MATVKNFEDLVIWKMARSFSQKVFELTCVDPFARDYSLRNQINASSGSIMDNILEGFERGGNKEFITFLSYAKGSAGESRSQLYRAFDRKYIDKLTFNKLKEESIEIGNRIGKLMIYLQNSDYKVSKFHEPEEPYSTEAGPLYLPVHLNQNDTQSQHQPNPEPETRNPEQNTEHGTRNPEPL